MNQRSYEDVDLTYVMAFELSIESHPLKTMVNFDQFNTSIDDEKVRSLCQRQLRRRPLCVLAGFTTRATRLHLFDTDCTSISDVYSNFAPRSAEKVT